jgi:aminopeptidase N
LLKTKASRKQLLPFSSIFLADVPSQVQLTIYDRHICCSFSFMQSFKYFIALVFISASLSTFGQEKKFTHQDTLRGTITPERAWWDLTYYHLSVNVDIESKSLSGSNVMQYKVLEPHNSLQIELQEPLKITKVLQAGKEVTVKKDGYTYFLQLSEKQKTGDVNEVVIHYEGVPQEGKNPPWEGGLTWKADSAGTPWIVTTCQGLGASIWWPNKDHAYDEPDSMLISITVPENLTDVSNGRLRSEVKNEDGTKTFNWFVGNPINNYGVNMNIGDYVHYSEVYKGLNGDLDCNYYVLRGNLEKAKKQFAEVPRMLKAFEHWFGPYPFYDDGFKLIEVPYAGMEHQSSVTYGNKFENGYLGRDVSHSGWGMKFDFIIVHESGHEWFANNITHVDVADMWIHEGFTSYSENLFVDYHFGKEACDTYVQGVRKNVLNDSPIIGIYDVHHEGSADMYYKGANILHTLRSWVDNDSLWRAVLTGLNKDFFHQTVTTQQVEKYMSDKIGKDLSAFFNQYLRTVKVPKLEYKVTNKVLKIRYVNVVENFAMPVRATISGKTVWLTPTEKWQSVKLDDAVGKVVIDPNFYVEHKNVGSK